MNILGIETSCDETAAAVVSDGPELISNIISSHAKTHAKYGGVVPEVASREHITRVVGAAQAACEPVGGFSGIDAIAVTAGPGLIGALLVGVQFAKGLALGRGIPWLGVNHLEGHLSAALLDENPPGYPHIALIVSGGHTQLYHVHDFGDYEPLGGTRDDAAGEAFDKIAKVLGLGYPGGVEIEKTGRGGDPDAIALPRGIPNKKILEFSFSGLKTAASEYIRQRGGSLQGDALRDFCASAQEAIVDILTKKAVIAARERGVPGVVLAGGVAANTRLRELLDERCRNRGLWSYAPPRRLCTDNAAMIAMAGLGHYQRGVRTDWQLVTRSRWPLTRAQA